MHFWSLAVKLILTQLSHRCCKSTRGIERVMQAVAYIGLVRLKLAQTMKLDNSRTKSQRGYTQNSSFSTHAVAALKPTTPEPSSLHSLQVLHTTKFCPDIRIHKIIQGALLDRKACLAGYVKLWLSREPLLRSIPAVKQLPLPGFNIFLRQGAHSPRRWLLLWPPPS